MVHGVGGIGVVGRFMGGGVHGGVGGWRVHGWMSMCTHPSRSVGHDGQVGIGVTGGWA